MNNPTAYISCPISVPMLELKKVEDKLRAINWRPNYWIRGSSYSDKGVRTADAVVFILFVGNEQPLKTWRKDLNCLSMGTKKELELATTLNKPIFIAYQTMDNEVNFYTASIRSKRENDTLKMIEGTQGTSNEITDLRSRLLDPKWQAKQSVFPIEKIEERKEELKKKGIVTDGLVMYYDAGRVEDSDRWFQDSLQFARNYGMSNTDQIKLIRCTSLKEAQEILGKYFKIPKINPCIPPWKSYEEYIGFEEELLLFF
jgi:hypothetical protein